MSEKAKPTRNVVQQMIRNAVSTFRSLRGLTDAANTGQTRNIAAECGHPEFITPDDYWKKFDRGDVANRVVSIYPEECFGTAPLIYEQEDEEETEFEKEWKLLDEELSISSFWLRADILSGVGRFGVMLLGFDDGLALNQPVAGVGAVPAAKKEGSPVQNVEPPPEPAAEKPKRRLMYLRTFDESMVTIKELETDERNPRFGQPKMYSITFWDQNTDLSAANPFQTLPPPSGFNTVQQMGNKSVKDVHWTRIVHLADNRLRDEIFGVPRLKRCYDRVLDLHKIAGGDAEIFWKQAKGGLALETENGPDGMPVEIDREGTKDEMEAFYEGMKPYIVLENMKANRLSPESVDPGPHAELQIRLICISMACPWRIFMGAEVGALASGQDIVAWNGRIQKRREEYVSAFVIRPFIDRLIEAGVLPFPAGGKGKTDANAIGDGRKPRPVYVIWWNDLNTPSNAEQADVAVKRTDAMAKYVAGGVDQLIAPAPYMEMVVGFKKDEVDAILAEVGDRLIETDPEAEAAQAAADAELSHQRTLEKIQVAGAVKAPGGNGNGNPFPAKK
jgi:hypothetical protein